MGDLAGKLAMLHQMRWRDAHKATGADGDAITDRLIRTHQTIAAMEAAAAGGVPERVWMVDIHGYPLDPEHAWNKPE